MHLFAPAGKRGHKTASRSVATDVSHLPAGITHCRIPFPPVKMSSLPGVRDPRVRSTEYLAIRPPSWFGWDPSNHEQGDGAVGKLE